MEFSPLLKTQWSIILLTSIGFAYYNLFIFWGTEDFSKYYFSGKTK